MLDSLVGAGGVSSMLSAPFFLIHFLSLGTVLGVCPYALNTNFSKKEPAQACTRPVRVGEPRNHIRRLLYLYHFFASLSSGMW